MANEILDLTAELIAVSDPWLKVSRNAKKGIVLPEVVPHTVFSVSDVVLRYVVRVCQGSRSCVT